MSTLKEWHRDTFETPPEPKDAPEVMRYRLDHVRGCNTWGLWTEYGRLIKQATLNEIMEWLEVDE